MCYVRKMKKSVFILLSGITLTLQSCMKPEVIPDVLPPLSHEGANTFGAYIGDNIFLPLNNYRSPMSWVSVPIIRTSFYRNVNAGRDEVDFTVMFRNRNRIRDEHFYFTFFADSLIAGNTYIMPTANEFNDYNHHGIIYKMKVDHDRFVDFKSDSTLPFSVHIHHIVRGNDSSDFYKIKELSATFSGLLIDAANRTIEVRDGRFDLQGEIWLD